MSVQPTWEVRCGDALNLVSDMPDGAVTCVVTSPPYWGLRDYGHVSQFGLEPTPREYVANLVELFDEIRRVLVNSGTVWLNLGDCYAANRSYQVSDQKHLAHDFGGSNASAVPPGLKPKDLVGIPWRVAFALQEAGWYLRSDIIWAKPNPMPESVTDRPTRSHEYIFLLSKSSRYFYDAGAVRETSDWGRENNPDWQKQRAETNAKKGAGNRNAADSGFTAWQPENGRNKRSVWTVATQPYPEAHFATFPPKLIEPCILAGSAERDTVLDPFCGSGTTGMVALRHNRSFVGIDLNPDYCDLARNRIRDDAPLLNSHLEVAA